MILASVSPMVAGESHTAAPASFNAATFEAAVPSPPEPGTMWGVNFFRNVPSTSWAPTSGIAHEPWAFNAMTFTGKTR